MHSANLPPFQQAKRQGKWSICDMNMWGNLVSWWTSKFLGYMDLHPSHSWELIGIIGRKCQGWWVLGVGPPARPHSVHLLLLRNATWFQLKVPFFGLFSWLQHGFVWKYGALNLIGYCHAPHSTTHFGVYPIFRHTHVSTDFYRPKDKSGPHWHSCSRSCPKEPAIRSSELGQRVSVLPNGSAGLFEHRRVVLHASNGMSKKGVCRITLKIAWLLIILPKNIAATDSASRRRCQSCEPQWMSPPCEWTPHWHSSHPDVTADQLYFKLSCRAKVALQCISVYISVYSIYNNNNNNK